MLPEAHRERGLLGTMDEFGKHVHGRLAEVRPEGRSGKRDSAPGVADVADVEPGVGRGTLRVVFCRFHLGNACGPERVVFYRGADADDVPREHLREDFARKPRDGKACKASARSMMTGHQRLAPAL